MHDDRAHDDLRVLVGDIAALVANSPFTRVVVGNAMSEMHHRNRVLWRACGIKAHAES